MCQILNIQCTSKGGNIKAIKGNIGDYKECNKIFKYIQQQYKNIDLLICNACAPPFMMNICPKNMDVYTEYVRRNIQLLYMPLSLAEQILNREGEILFISSAYVREIQKSLPQYIGMKAESEILVKCYAKTNPIRKVSIFRIPKILTEMNNSPTGRIGAISPNEIANIIANLEKNNYDSSSNCFQYQISSNLEVTKFD